MNWTDVRTEKTLLHMRSLVYELLTEHEGKLKEALANALCVEEEVSGSIGFKIKPYTVDKHELRMTISFAISKCKDETGKSIVDERQICFPGLLLKPKDVDDGDENDLNQKEHQEKQA
jgi:hypothetical protein